MDLKQLRCFVTVANVGSLSKASEILYIAQPPLSVKIASLESEVGVKLFVRGSKGMLLTSEGEKFMSHATRILKSVNDAFADLKRTEVRGRISIGMFGTISELAANDILRCGLRELPGVHLTILEDSPRNLQKMVANHEVDLAVLINGIDCSELEVVSLFKQDYCVIGPQDQATGEDTICWQELARLPLLLGSARSTTRQLIDQVASGSGIVLSPIAELESPHLMKSAVRAGLGFAVLARGAAQASPGDSFWVRGLVDPEMHVSIGLASSRTRESSVAQEAVKQLVISVLSKVGEQRARRPAAALAA